MTIVVVVAVVVVTVVVAIIVMAIVVAGHHLELDHGHGGVAVLADGVQAELCMQVAHLPCDINRDGNVGQTDPPAFAAEFTGRKSPYLADINGDGNVGQTDPPAFAVGFLGAQGTSLPPKPSCP